MTVAFHISVLPDHPVAEISDLAERADELGFAGIWIADSQSIFRDAFSALTMCAMRTQSLRLATGVTNPITRHPAVLAGTFATIDELSGGRAIIGIGLAKAPWRRLSSSPHGWEGSRR